MNIRASQSSPLAAVVTCGILLQSGVAGAEGRFPQANQIVFSPSDENRIVLRTTYGILPSHDNGASWSFICEDAVGYGPATSRDPAIALMNDNSLIVGSPNGMNVSAGAGLGATDDPGCNWNCIPPPLAGQNFVDDALRPDNPSSAVALSSTFIASDSGTGLFDNQVFETTDNGSTWNPIGTPIDPQAVVYTIDVAQTDPNRIYVSATNGYGAGQIALLYVSIDKGQTWKKAQFSSEQYDPSMEEAIFIGAVDPTNANRLYLRSQAQGTGGISRLTTVDVAPDGTPSFTTTRVFDSEASFEDAGELLGLALSPDGSKIYVGTVEQGLWVADTSTLNFQQANKVAIQCLETRQTSKGTELWACSAPVDGFVAGVSYDDGKTFTPKMRFIGSLTGPIACSPGTSDAGSGCGESANASQCKAIYQTFCSVEQCGTPDAASADAAAIMDATATGSIGSASSGSSTPKGDASTGGSPSSGSSSPKASTAPEGKSSSDCSCDLASADQGGDAVALGAVTALAAIAHRRRRRRDPPSRRARLARRARARLVP